MDRSWISSSAVRRKRQSCPSARMDDARMDAPRPASRAARMMTRGVDALWRGQEGPGLIDAPVLLPEDEPDAEQGDEDLRDKGEARREGQRACAPRSEPGRRTTRPRMSAETKALDETFVFLLVADMGWGWQGASEKAVGVQGRKSGQVLASESERAAFEVKAGSPRRARLQGRCAWSRLRVG